MTDTLVEALKGLDDGQNPPPAAKVELGSRPTSELIPLLGNTELNDAARLVMLHAIAQRATRADVAALGRVSRKQRPRVLRPSVELLEKLGGPEAVFTLARSLGARDDEGGALARSAAERLAAEDESCALVREADVDMLPALETRELGFAVLSADLAQVQRLRPLPSSHPAATAIATALEQLDGEARDALQSNTQNEHDAAVRNAVYDTLLIADAPVHPSMRERAEELLMRRPAADVEAVLQAVDSSTRLRYVDRVLRPEHREKRADRVLLAMAALASGDSKARFERRNVIAQCLTVESQDVRVAAASALLKDERDRRTVNQVFDAAREMDEMHRHLAYAALTPGEPVGELVPVESMLEWASATVDPDDALARQSIVLDRLAEAPADDLPAWIDVAGRSASDNERRLIASLTARLQRASEQGQVGVVAASIGRHPTAPTSLLSHLDGFAGLEPGPARDTMVALVADEASRVERIAALLAAAAPSELSAARREALARIIVSEPRAIQSVADVVGDSERSQLLAATIDAFGLVHVELSRLRGLDGAEQLRRQRGLVLQAIDEAMAGARGMDVLLEQLQAIARAIDAVGTSPPDEHIDEVRSIREGLASRYPTVIELADHSGRLELRADAPTETLGRLAAELGQHILSPRGARRELHAGLEPDLDQVVDALAAAAQNDPQRPLGRLPSEVEQRVWARWAERQIERGEPSLSTAIADIAGPDSRSALMRVDALIAAHGSDRLPDVAAELSPEITSAVLTPLQRALSFRQRELTELRSSSARADLTALEGLADRLAPSLAAIDEMLSGYFRLRERLDAVGLERVELSLGSVVRHADADPARHVMPDDSEAESFYVRTHGLRVRGGTTRQALLRPLDSGVTDDQPR